MEYIPKDKVLELWRYWKFIEAYDQVKAMPGIKTKTIKYYDEEAEKFYEQHKRSKDNETD